MYDWYYIILGLLLTATDNTGKPRKACFSKMIETIVHLLFSLFHFLMYVSPVSERVVASLFSQRVSKASVCLAGH